MCRMILAVGRFDPQQVAAAATLMSEGATAIEVGPTQVHRDGWGALYRRTSTSELFTYRSLRPLADGLEGLSLPSDGVDLLALHARHATLASTRGIAFTHPVSRDDSSWYLMHNGYMPTVYRELGLDHSSFDTREYFDYIVPGSDLRIDGRELLAKLERLAPGGSSANAFLFNSERAYAFNWFPPDSRYAGFYRMWSLYTDDAIYIASDPIATLGEATRWQPLPVGRLVEIHLGACTRASAAPALASERNNPQ